MENTNIKKNKFINQKSLSPDKCNKIVFNFNFSD